ncbi:hypothetical protein J6590_064960 [Homalodisca vitripennis]|nr:hypothetical protein J6590_064960 [Homalodisca vitripennis]
MLFLVLIASVIAVTSSLDLKELDRKYDFDFLKDIFKFKIDVNPHPVCALEGEKIQCCECFEFFERAFVGFRGQRLSKLLVPTPDSKVFHCTHLTSPLGCY